MQSVSDHDIQVRIERDNPWWARGSDAIPEATLPERIYLNPFQRLALNFSIRRAAVMLGPRRVGKTVMAKQLIARAIASGLDPTSILYVSIDTPIYAGIALEDFVSYIPDSDPSTRKLVIFDEIQYLKNWEIHLKDLVDTRANIKFVATGSAAAALRLKSQESGAGRFSDFMLPPLTFSEFLKFLDEEDRLIKVSERVNPVHGVKQAYYEAVDLGKLNARFIDYLNYGGYPEAVLNESIRANPDQFIRNDIIDKVLLKDLPSLYGIQEIQELNKLFSFLAYNAGSEASLEKISQGSGITKPTIKRYMEYLESAFLIIKVSNVDDNCRSLQRERNFKIYLNNPSMRAALFAPVEKDDATSIGHLAESAIFSQWQHSPNFLRLRYARWRNEGEVDVVSLDSLNQRPFWIGEIKWSDRYANKPGEETRAMRVLLQKHSSIKSCFLTTKTLSSETELEGRHLTIQPSALYCYSVGRNIARSISEGT